MSKIFTIDFTKSFIDELAAYIEREYIAVGRPLDRLAIVFGGQRPVHFLKRALGRRFGRAFISPRFYTIDVLMNEIADDAGVLKPLTAVEERYELFKLAGELTPQLLAGRETFAQFLPWAAEIGDFIDELDLEDISAAALKNIEASARIGYPVPPDINVLLERVLLLREAFHQRLLSRGRTRRSFQYLRAKEHIASAALSFDEIIFANFFYFHRTEEAVARHLFAAGRATLTFQGDQRKWPVLERISRRFGCELLEGEQPVPTTFKLDAYCAFDAHGEAAMARDILAGIADLSSTVVILPDSGSLMPLLSSFPENMAGFNVSMGYPLKRGSLYVLLSEVFKAQISRREGLYYARDYLAVWHHPLVKSLRLAGDGAVLRVLSHKVEELLKGRLTGEVSGKSFITLDEIEAEPLLLSETLTVLAGMGVAVSNDTLKAAVKELHGIFFQAWADIDSLPAFAAALGALLAILQDKGNRDAYPLNSHIATSLSAIRESFEQGAFQNERFTIEEMIKVFEDIAGREMVHFSGTPLKGLQVLGLFETRTLNFDQVIVMDTNEGVLPRVEARASLIPREVMSQLGVDRLELEEEIQRYQFMRVISSAKNVHVIYQQNKEKSPSRFLEELIWEQQVREGVLRAFPAKRAAFQTGVSARRREVVKTPRMMAFLKNFIFSASSVNTYLQNPYEFYTRHVLGLREQEDQLDEPDAVIIGNFFHQFLEQAYQPFVGRKPVVDDAFEKHFNGLFERHFKVMFSQRMRSGDFLVHQVMEHKLKAFLACERERSARVERLLVVEGDYPGELRLPSGNYLFKTRIDRVEELAGGQLSILDYKTGSSDRLPNRPLFLSDAPDREEIFNKVHSFQLPLYMYFVSRALPGRLVNAGLYLLRSAEIKYFFTERYPIQPLEGALAPYWQALDIILGEIMDPERPFEDNDLSPFV
ncbi:MAG: PD-(D/E)XK nuclease family protein [Candidatus Omnitrophica bacterium]|nr:PD-(D/E)XK nuclease family protein [Candidatus Omnitrophota bacterium]